MYCTWSSFLCTWLSTGCIIVALDQEEISRWLHDLLAHRRCVSVAVFDCVAFVCLVEIVMLIFRRESSGYGLIVMKDGKDITDDDQLDTVVSELNSNSTVTTLDERLDDPDEDEEGY